LLGAQLSKEARVLPLGNHGLKLSLPEQFRSGRGVRFRFREGIGRLGDGAFAVRDCVFDDKFLLVGKCGSSWKLHRADLEIRL
jgi:hypothetical protein